MIARAALKNQNNIFLKNKFYRHFKTSSENKILNQLKTLRGCDDIIGKEAEKHAFLKHNLAKIAQLYSYQPIETPIIESKDIFDRCLGSDSDVISKEMYVFNHMSENKIALRPEGTAGVVRAFINSHLNKPLPQKFYYYGPMFRYERPQKGRNRQFHQLGAEFIGGSTPLLDAESIAFASNMLSQLNLMNNVKLEINTLGDNESRTNYRGVLKKYFEDKINLMSIESKQRFERGSILRILDSKDPGDIEIINKAPNLYEFLTKDSLTQFNQVIECLQELEIKFNVNPHLVRGLDYYCHTVFEFIGCNSTNIPMGRQSTVLAGGRYDGLVKLFGGPDVSSIGWAAGIERLALMINDELLPKKTRPISVIIIQDKNNFGDINSDSDNNNTNNTNNTNNSLILKGLNISERIRKLNIPVIFNLSGSIQKQLKRATKDYNCQLGIIIGIKELEENIIKIKQFDNEIQNDYPLNQLEEIINQLYNNNNNDNNNL
eukprot:TRINITY_DN849_c0_g6_i1.p1 TRINITY_DN849_c0_g6~~TRINITY_DN849_c0_g6_i1.p1  ORF type:complete len:489 (+),score=195.47 TRINITY_DN849_c0_g6_i1:44-1510(+)